MIKEFSRTLNKILQEEIDNYTSDLASGQPATYDEYKRLVGLIQGLGLAQQRVTDLAKSADEDGDDY